MGGDEGAGEEDVEEYADQMKNLENVDDIDIQPKDHMIYT